MTTRKNTGHRVYELLIPVSVPDPRPPMQGQPSEPTIHTAITLRPMTFADQRAWEAGEIDGRKGMLDALMRRLSVTPFAVIDGMVYPDSDLFLDEFMLHLPPAVRASIAEGRMPSPAVPQFTQGGPTASNSADPSPAPYVGPDADPGEPETVYEPDEGYTPDAAMVDDGQPAPGPGGAYGVDLT